MLGTVLLGRRTLEMLAEHTGHGSESHHSLCIFLFGSLQVLKYSQLLEAVDIAGALDFCREGFCWKKSESLLGTDY